MSLKDEAVKVVKKFCNDVLTARDNVSYSMSKVVGISAGVALVEKYSSSPAADPVAFATSIGIIMGALAVKYAVETIGEKKDVPPAA